MRHRLLSYFQTQPPGARPAADHSRLRPNSATDPGTCAHELAALRELELIRRWAPRFNVREACPADCSAALHLPGPGSGRIYLASQPSARTQDCHRPVPATHRMRRAVRAAQRLSLANCSDRPMFFFRSTRAVLEEAERLATVPASRPGHLSGAPAPACAARPTMQQVRAPGHSCTAPDDSVLAAEVTMLAAAADRQFERATNLLGPVARTDLAPRANRARSHLPRRDYSFVYPGRSRRPGSFWFCNALSAGRSWRSPGPRAIGRDRRRCDTLLDEVVYQSGRPVARLMTADSFCQARSDVHRVAAWFT